MTRRYAKTCFAPKGIETLESQLLISLSPLLLCSLSPLHSSIIGTFTPRSRATSTARA